MILFVSMMASAGAAAPSDKANEGKGDAHTKELLKLMDADANGKISRAEFMDFMSKEFDRLDVNKDGELDVKELTQLHYSSKRTGGAGR